MPLTEQTAVVWFVVIITLCEVLVKKKKKCGISRDKMEVILIKFAYVKVFMFN